VEKKETLQPLNIEQGGKKERFSCKTTKDVVSFREEKIPNGEGKRVYGKGLFLVGGKEYRSFGRRGKIWERVLFKGEGILP